MLDWNGYRGELMGAVGEIAKLNPDLMKGHDTLAASATAGKVLDAKTRELIAIAVAVTTRCDGCIAVHTQAAKDAGASKEEIMEALTVAVALNAGAALVYSARAMDALASAT